MILESSKINITYGHVLSTIYLFGIISFRFTRERIKNCLYMADQFMSFHMMTIKQPSLQFYGMIYLVQTIFICRGMAWLPFQKLSVSIDVSQVMSITRKFNQKLIRFFAWKLSHISFKHFDIQDLKSILAALLHSTLKTV